jgi:hypothetical protein
MKKFVLYALFVLSVLGLYFFAGDVTVAGFWSGSSTLAIFRWDNKQKPFWWALLPGGALGVAGNSLVAGYFAGVFLLAFLQAFEDEPEMQIE